MANSDRKYDHVAFSSLNLHNTSIIYVLLYVAIYPCVDNLRLQILLLLFIILAVMSVSKFKRDILLG